MFVQRHKHSGRLGSTCISLDCSRCVVCAQVPMACPFMQVQHRDIRTQLLLPAEQLQSTTLINCWQAPQPCQGCRKACACHISCIASSSNSCGGSSWSITSRSSSSSSRKTSSSTKTKDERFSSSSSARSMVFNSKIRGMSCCSTTPRRSKCLLHLSLAGTSPGGDHKHDQPLRVLCLNCWPPSRPPNGQRSHRPPHLPSPCIPLGALRMCPSATS